jgi:short-subunit dehydrogenase
MEPARGRLSGKVAVVTGASQGLGEHLAANLAAEGASVALAARNHERLKKVQDQIETRGGNALAIPCDLSIEEEGERLVAEARQAFGPIDILVLNAGTATFARLEELDSLKPIRTAMDINFFGAACPTFYALNDLIDRKGLIAYVTSGSGHLPMASYLGYSTSKHAMNGFFECLRLEMFPHGVDVLTINPGDMYSEDGAGRTFLTSGGQEIKLDLSHKRKNDIKRVPASKVAEECCEAIIERRREVDASPRIQKVATRARPFAPGLIDRRIYKAATSLRSAFDDDLAKKGLAPKHAKNAQKSPDATTS